MQAIIDAINKNELNANIKLLVTDNKNAYAIQRVQNEKIPIHIISASDKEERAKELEKELENYEIDLIVLAGYLKMISSNLIKKYKIINTHPSLLPKFGGKGMYGMNVHKAVVEAKEKITGVTVHYVDEHYDTGSIIMQTKVKVEENDTAEDVSAKVQKAEKIQLVKVLKEFEAKL